MTKRILAIGKRSGKRWVTRVQESAAIEPVTVKGIRRGVEQFYQKEQRSAAK